MTEKWSAPQASAAPSDGIARGSGPATVVAAAIAPRSRAIGPPICIIVASLTLFLTTRFPPEWFESRGWRLPARNSGHSESRLQSMVHCSKCAPRAAI